MKEKESDNYRFCFVFPMIGYGIPLGGRFLTFQMANELRKKGHSVCIIIDRRSLWNEAPFHGKKDGNLSDRLSYHINKILWRVIYGQFFQMHISKIYRKIKSIDPSYHKLINSFPIFFVDDFSKSNISCKEVITESALASFSVYDYCKNHNSRGYRLIFHDDRITQSDPVLRLKTEESYSLPLQKIVFNAIEFERFKEYKPYIAQIWYDSESFRMKQPFDNRPPLSLIMPLRKVESKGAIYGIETLKIIHDKIPEMIIITYGDFDSEKIPDFVHHYVNPSKEKLVDLFNSVRIFCLPSIYEGFSLPTIEAMACGAVPVVTDCGGVREFIIDGFNGIIVPVKDPQSMFLAVKRLIEDVNFMKKLHENAKQSVRKYSRENARDAFISLFNP